MAKTRKIAFLYLIAFCEIFAIFCQTNIIGISTVYVSLIECLCVCLYLFIFFFNKSFNKSALFLLSCFIACIFVSFLIHRTGVEYMCNLLILLLALLIVKADDGEKIDFSFKNRIIAFLPVLIILILLILKTPEGAPDLELLPGQINPNGFGFILFILSTVFLSYYCQSKNKLSLVLSLLFFLFQIRYSSRISILSNLLVYFLFLFSRINKSAKLKWLYSLLAFLIIMQFVFPYIYADLLFKLIGKGKIFILGKDIFTGRQIIWTEWFEQMQGNYLFGIGNNFVSTWEMDGVTDGRISIHNSALAIISNFGIIAFISFALLVLRIFKSKKKLPLSENGLLLDCTNLIYLSAVMLNGLTDTVLISGFNVGGIVLGLLLINLFKFGERKGDF